MTKGSWIHDVVSQHFKICAQCQAAQPEAVRVTQPGKKGVPEATLAEMCSEGRSKYESYLKWLAEPEE